MAVLAVLMPLVMLGVVLALGRYEELMLTPPAVRRRSTPLPPARVVASTVLHATEAEHSRD